MTGRVARPATRALCELILAAIVASVAACSTASPLRRELEQRYPVSLIEVQNPATKGEVVERRMGVVLAVQANVPAKEFRVLQAGPKGPRFHARDYARVDIDGERLSTAGPGQVTIPRGTELVLLDLAVKDDGVHFFLHTAKSLRTADDRAVYGCTEMVFHVDRVAVERNDVVTIRRLIERWLTPVASR